MRERVALEQRGGVFVLRLAQAPDDEVRFDRALVDGVSGALDAVEAVLSGDSAPTLVTLGSQRFYSNGYDLEWLATLSRDERRAFIRDTQHLLARLLVFPTATVAAVSGHAIGAGALLALAHDVRVVRSDHGFFCLPEVDAGIPLRRGMSALVRARLSPASVGEAVLTGRRYTGPECVAERIADVAVEEDALLDEACRRASARGGKHPETLAALKRGLYEEAWQGLSRA